MVDVSSNSQLPIEGDIPHTMPRRDAEDLRWFFRRGGSALFEHSTMGPLLARAECISTGAEPCLTCGGAIYRNPDGTIRRERAGTGIVPKDPRAYARVVEAERQAWLAQGIDPPLDYPPPVLDNVECVGTRSRDADGAYVDADYLGTVCDRCRGTGWIPCRQPRLPPDWPTSLPCDDASFDAWEQRQITAWPTGSSIRSHLGGSVSIGEVDMARMGVIAGRLAAVDDYGPEVKPSPVAVLAAYYGEAGDQLLPLYPLTDAGRRLLRRSQNVMVDLTPMQRLENELAEDRRQTDAGRKALIDRAHDQAVELYQSACRTWNRVVHVDDVMARAAARRERRERRISEILTRGSL